MVRGLQNSVIVKKWGRARGAGNTRAMTSFEVGRDPAEDAKIRASAAFHLAFPVRSIQEAKTFYGPDGVLGCIEGRSTDRWVDYNFWGAQLVCHLVEGYDAAVNHNNVDGDPVPVPHFGLAMTLEAFEALARRVEEKNVRSRLLRTSGLRANRGSRGCSS